MRAFPFFALLLHCTVLLFTMEVNENDTTRYESEQTTSTASVVVDMPAESLATLEDMGVHQEELKDPKDFRMFIKKGRLPRTDGNRPFSCPHCEFRFKNAYTLKEHMYLHMGDAGKRFKCQYCPYASTRRNVLRNHILKRHLTMWPFKCPQCNQHFKTFRARSGHECPSSQNNGSKSKLEQTYDEIMSMSMEATLAPQQQSSAETTASSPSVFPKQEAPYPYGIDLPTQVRVETMPRQQVDEPDPCAFMADMVSEQSEPISIQMGDNRPSPNSSSSITVTRSANNQIIQDDDSGVTVTISGGKAYFCEPCKAIFLDMPMYLIHKSLHHSADPFRCNFCNAEFGEKYTFMSHFLCPNSNLVTDRI